MTQDFDRTVLKCTVFKQVKTIKTLKLSALFFVTFGLYVPPSAAENAPNWWGVSVGQINVFRDNQFKNNLYGVETRFEPITRWSLVPSIGYQWSESGVSYLYTDMRWRKQLNEHFIFNIHSGIGLFDDGEFLDLGHTVQFRSGFELDYVIDQKKMIGLVFNHFSNSRLSDVNPGTESVSLLFLNRF